MAGPPKWVPLESNPEVLNDFASKLGLDTSQYAFCDVFGLDDDLLGMVPQPVLAVIMCYPITAATEEAAKKEDSEQASKAITSSSLPYYMKQTISNACGTIAVLHCLANNQDAAKPAPGSFFEQFFGATASMDPDARGTYLEKPPAGAPNIEEAHAAAAQRGDTAPPSEEEAVDLHYVTFIVHADRLWQLDGRRKGPVDHGPASKATILHDAIKVVKHFVEGSESLNFNVIALAAPSDM